MLDELDMIVDDIIDCSLSPLRDALFPTVTWLLDFFRRTLYSEEMHCLLPVAVVALTESLMSVANKIEMQCLRWRC